uniref:NADH dehydrogenase subunit 9 n=1 Tax=Halteria grandinella TaxID=5974 RepID=A0A7T0M4Q7_HALGN|nr:NADH dehydrogenase subunit 9 [Halteria grandinella]QPL16004.1 NADH dehydrogenase subunit 9 [Halteria grandinella]
MKQMNLNYKLFFKYILFHTNQVFLKYLYRSDKNTNIYITENNFYYLTLHIKLSSLFYSTQLTEIFSYEIPFNKNINKNDQNISLINNSILVYNFHSILFQQRFFLFVISNTKQNIKKNNINWNSLNSITELFLNANWLEREVSELHGIFFSNKKDLRNLMLTYGDTSAPMRKSFPSIGIKEVFYDSTTDLLIQNPVSIQF